MLYMFSLHCGLRVRSCVYVCVFPLIVMFSCQYRCNQLAGKTHHQSDPLYINWDIKPCSLTHPIIYTTHALNVL